MSDTYIDLKRRYENSSLEKNQSEILRLRLENAKLKLKIKKLERKINENFND